MKQNSDNNIYIIDTKFSTNRNFNEKELVILPATVIGFNEKVLMTQSESGIKFYLTEDYNKYYFGNQEEAISQLDYLSELLGSANKLEKHFKKVRKYVEYANRIGVQLNNNPKTLRKQFA